MSSINQRLRILQQHAPAALHTPSLTDALRFADDDEINPLAEAILETPSIAGYETILHQYYHINETIRQKISPSDPKFLIALARIAHSSSTQLRLLALQLIESLRVINCIPTVEDQFNLQNNPPEIIELAARILLNLTRRLTKPASRTTAQPALLQQLDQAIATAIDHYPAHRRPEILLSAALLSPKPGPALTKFFNDQDHPAHFAMRGVLKKFDDNLIADSALDWLTLSRLAPQLIDRIARIARTKHLAAILTPIHLLLIPIVRSRLQRLDTRFPCTLSPDLTARSFTPLQQLHLIRWLNTIPMKNTDRIALLTDALAFTNPAARLAALRALTSLHSPEANAAAESFTFDHDEQIARIATRHIIRNTNSATPNLLNKLLESPHPSVRQLAENHLALHNLDSLFAAFAALTYPDPHTKTPPDRAATERKLSILRLAFRRTLLRDKPALIRLLRKNILTTDRKTALPAIRLIDRLNLTKETELELLAIAAEHNPRITSAVMTLLASLQSNASRDALYAGLQHPDSRVRANAIEALRNRHRHQPTRKNMPDPNWKPAVEHGTIADDNRLRANAIRALADLDPQESTRRLKIMLRDPRPLHRVSALWLAGKQGPLDCAIEVATLAKNDDLQPVRSRAASSAARLLGRLSARKLPPYQPNSHQPQTITPTITPSISPRRAQFASTARPLASLFIFLTTLSAITTQSFAQSPATTTGDSRLNKISQSFTDSFTSHHTTSAGWTTLLWIMGIIIFIITLALLIHLQKNDLKNFGPNTRSIARKLGLSRLQTTLLNHLARRAGLPNALPLIISRGTFNHYTTTYLNSKSLTTKTLRKPLQSILNSTKLHLFSTDN